MYFVVYITTQHSRLASDVNMFLRNDFDKNNQPLRQSWTFSIDRALHIQTETVAKVIAKLVTENLKFSGDDTEAKVLQYNSTRD